MATEGDLISVEVDMTMHSPDDTPETVFDRTAQIWGLFRAMGFAPQCILVGHNTSGTHIVLNAQERQFTIRTGAHRVNYDMPDAVCVPLPHAVVALIRDLVLDAGFVMPATMN